MQHVELCVRSIRNAQRVFLRKHALMLVYVQERRVIEYVSLGDFQTAVGFLLASTPEKSIRYYRDALCTLALAVSSFAIVCQS